MNGLQTALLLIPMSLSSTVFAVDYLNDSQAQKILVPEANEFAKIDVNLSDDDLKKIRDLAGVAQRNSKPNVWKAKKNGKLVAFFYKDEVVGKHEFITFAVAITPDGTVRGLEIMSYRETHGSEIRNESWRKNFKGKKLSDPFKLDVDVPNITGATLSSRNILDGVKRILAIQTLMR